MTGIPFIDSSASAILEEVIKRSHDAGDHVILFGANNPVKEVMEKTGLLVHLGDEYLLDTRLDALLKAQSIIKIRS